MTPTITSKLPDVGTTIFTVMSQLALDEKAINLSQGFPDFQPPKRLMTLFDEHMSAGHNQYAHMPGIPPLRQAIAEKTERCYAVRPDENNEVTVMTGATECLFVAFQAFVHPGDEVIVFDPAYDAYDPAIRLAGGAPVHLPLQEPGFSIDWDRVRDAISQRTRVIVINSPHNPSGAILGEADIQALKEITADHDILLFSDEVYEHIIFDGRQHLSLVMDEQLRARSVVISSFGKTYHTTGWKVGYTIAPPEMTTELRRVHQFVTFCTNTPAQFAYAEYLTEDPAHYLDLPDFYQRKRDLFCDLIKDSRFSFQPTAGTYFQLVDYSQISDLNDVDFCRWITREFKVAAIPITVFYQAPPNQQRLCRFCFAKDDETLKKACDRLNAM
jgi:methionine aminotransferase